MILTGSWNICKWIWWSQQLSEALCFWDAPDGTRGYTVNRAKPQRSWWFHHLRFPGVKDSLRRSVIQDGVQEESWEGLGIWQGCLLDPFTQCNSEWCIQVNVSFFFIYFQNRVNLWFWLPALTKYQKLEANFLLLVPQAILVSWYVCMAL